MSSGGSLYLEVNGDIIRDGASRGLLVVGFDVVPQHQLLRLAGVLPQAGGYYSKLFVAFDLTTSTNNDSYFSFSKEVLMHSLLVSND